MWDSEDKTWSLIMIRCLSNLSKVFCQNTIFNKTHFKKLCFNLSTFGIKDISTHKSQQE